MLFLLESINVGDINKIVWYKKYYITNNNYDKHVVDVYINWIKYIGYNIIDKKLYQLPITNARFHKRSIIHVGVHDTQRDVFSQAEDAITSLSLMG